MTNQREQEVKAPIDEHWRLLPQYEAAMREFQREQRALLVPNRLKGTTINQDGDAT